MSKIHTHLLQKPDNTALVSGFVIALMGTVLFSMKSIIVKFCYSSGIDTELLMAARYIVALPVYVAIGLFMKDRFEPEKEGKGKHILSAVVLGIVGYWLSSYLDFLGLQYISAQMERMILFTYPLMVVGFGWLILRQKPSTQAVFAALVSYLGLVVVFVQSSGAGQFFWEGAAFVLGSALTFALYQLYAKPVIKKLGVPVATSVMMSSASFASVVTLALTHHQKPIILINNQIGLVFLLSIGGTVLPSLLLNMALSKISSQANASIGALGPIVTIVLAATLLGERVSVVAACGMALVILGVAWFSVLEARHMRRKLT